MSDTTEALLTAHVQHELSRLRGEALTRLIEEHVSTIFVWLAEARLDDVASRDQILGVIDRYVIELRVSGGITELAGEMARKVIASEANAETTVDELLQSDSYEDFTEKIVALESLRKELFSRLVESPAFGVITTRILVRGFIDLLLPRGPTQGHARGLSAVAAELGAKLAPGLERRLEALLASYIEQHRERLQRDSVQHLVEAFDPQCLRAIADELWLDLSRLRLADAFTLIGERDLEDFVVLCHEFWLRFRKTPYFRQIMVEQVDHFFSKYGGETLASLIEDMGVTEQMVRFELETLLDPLLAHATRTGLLEQLIRSHLESFYRSPALARVLASERPLNDTA